MQGPEGKEEIIMHIANSGSKVDADVPAAFVPEGFSLVSNAADMSASTRENL